MAGVQNDDDVMSEEDVAIVVPKTRKRNLTSNGKKGGTSTIQRNKCLRRQMQDVGQMLLSAKNGQQVSTHARKIDQTKFREFVSKLIIARNLPLGLVEWPEFRDLCAYLNDDVNTLSRNTSKADILKAHGMRKEAIHKRLKCVPGEALAAKLFVILEYWGIEEKVCNITLDNAASNDRCIKVMKSRLVAKKIVFNKGKYFHVRCCAHILALILKDGLPKIDPAVIKVRKLVKYIKSSQIRKQNFFETVETLGISVRMGLHRDVKTRWNSTYLMLQSCIAYEDVFTHLKLMDKDYEDSHTEE
ncbi:zinc finger BED domain-containing protein RICESLEEPER 2-like [Papaver somniferum]|uniref:zinc finger BED domain-containing protein RICESLEEPER 2-like n=1 Tax=Papaver somniferum TaxID=3469 RepID=UPI000E702B0E|nr:zinc finger BED domain-containing protein RICESLEEPER 2-like [Papaver somniferum]